MDVVKQLQGELTQTKRKRRELMPMWQLSVEERKGKDSDTASDEGRRSLPIDWSITKSKAAQLFSQMPQVRLMPKREEFAPAVPVIAKAVNDTLVTAGIESVVSDCVVDCINKAGAAAAIVRYESLSEATQVPQFDEVTAAVEAQKAAMSGLPFENPMVPSTRVTDRRFCIDRVSPDDFLWPITHAISDWRKAPWLGHSGRCSWPQAKRMFAPNPATQQRGLTDEDRENVEGAGRNNDRNIARPNEVDRRATDINLVSYDELFYWRHIYHEDEKYYDAIQRVVFVVGIEEAVINEPWKGQEFDQENGGYLGSCLLPIQVLTLAYISDEAIPPSDSAIIRPLVKALEQSQQDQNDQRKHSRPLRWFDVDRVDPAITGDLLKGTWQGMIPTIGAGDKVIGEVARSSYPRENQDFDRALKQSIQEAVNVGPNQQGMFASGERSAAEAQIVQGSFQTEIGQQRAKVAAFVVGIAEVVLGLYALYGDPLPLLGQEGAQRFETGKRINQKFLCDVRPDSTVRLDAQQLVEQLKGVLNVTAQSGFINPKPLIQRIIELNGVDPAEVMVDPTPKGPEPPKVSFNFKGDDLLNPVVLAILAKNGMAPTPEELKAAVTMRAAAEGVVGLPGAQPGAPTPGAQGNGELEVPGGVGASFPNWESTPRVDKRRAE